MKITLGGIRGSFPVPSSGTSRVPVPRGFGDTVSILVEAADGAQILLDAGTGLRNLLPRLRPGSLLALTHFHLDHLLALPLLGPKAPAAILSARPDAADILARVFSPPVWPVPAVSCPFATAFPGSAPYRHGGLAVAFHPVAHPDGCHAIRIDEPATGRSCVLATDIEWGLMQPDARTAYDGFARGADELYFDCNFLPSELPAHRGWGHSTWREALDAARLCRARRIHPIHHAPSRTPADAAAIARRLRAAPVHGGKGDAVAKKA